MFPTRKVGTMPLTHVLCIAVDNLDEMLKRDKILNTVFFLPVKRASLLSGHVTEHGTHRFATQTRNVEMLSGALFQRDVSLGEYILPSKFVNAIQCAQSALVLA